MLAAATSRRRLMPSRRPLMPTPPDSSASRRHATPDYATVGARAVPVHNDHVAARAARRVPQRVRKMFTMVPRAA